MPHGVLRARRPPPRLHRRSGPGSGPSSSSTGCCSPRRCTVRWRKELAARGHRVVTIDLLGHGASDRPVDMREYSMTGYGGQVAGLLDHLGDRAGRGRRHVARREHDARGWRPPRPERVRGLVVEMPVLDNALLGLRDRLHAAHGRADLRRAGDARLVQRGRPARCRRRRAAGWPTSCSTRSARTRPRAPRSCRASSSSASPRPPRAPHARRAGARDRPPPRPVHPFCDSGALVEELPDARLLRGRLDPRAAPEPRAADRRDRRLPGRVLAAAPDGAARRRLTGAAPRRAQSRQAGASPR